MANVTSGNHLTIRSCTLRIITIDLDSYGLPNEACKWGSYDTTMWSKIFFHGLHHPYPVSLVDLRQHIWILIIVFKPFLHASMQNVFSHTPITLLSELYLPLWWNRKTASFMFYWAITETCSHLSSITSALLPPGFLMTLQMSSTF